MSTLTIKELLNAKMAFDRLTALDTVKPAIKLRLVPISRSVKQHIEDFNEAMISLFKQYGTPVENQPGNYEVRHDAPAENKQAVADGRESLLAESVQIPGKKIPYEAISEASYVMQDAGRVTLTTDDLVMLDWVIELPAEEAAEVPATAQAATA